MSDKKPIATITPIAPEGQNPSKCCVCTPLKFACFTFTYLTLVVNTFNTLMIVGVLITASVTTGFKFMRPTAFDAEHPTIIDTDEMAIDSEISSILLFVLYITGIILLLNTMWLCWNIYILVGLHMKRPGSVRLNVSIATVRLVLMIVPLWIGPGDFLILTWSEIGVTGLFIIFYYKYATQLERKQKPRIHNIENPQEKEITVTDVYFAYPKYLDKQHLVEKEKY